MLADETRRIGLHVKVQFHGQAGPPQRPQGVGPKRLLADGAHQAPPQVVPPSHRVDDGRRPGSRLVQGRRHGVDGEVAPPQVGLHVALQRLQVDVHRYAGAHRRLRQQHPRHPSLLGQREVVTAEGIRQLRAQGQRIAGDGEVHVADIAAQEGVSEEAADDVGRDAAAVEEVVQPREQPPDLGRYNQLGRASLASRSDETHLRRKTPPARS